MKDKGIVVVNQREGMEIPKVSASQKILVVPANEIAVKTIGRPLGNTALIGAFAAATGELELDTVLEAIKKRFSGKALEGNIEAVKQGFAFIKNMKEK